MANLIARRDYPSLYSNLGWPLDALSGVRDLMRWDPFAELQRALPVERTVAFTPTFDVKETKEGYLFKADLPGVKDQDVEVTLNENRLTVSGKRETDVEEKTDTYYNRERSYGTFVRSFTLPSGVDSDHCLAELKEGVLTINIPKTQKAAAKKIAIRAEKTKM